jgi:hypothetical protein
MQVFEIRRVQFPVDLTCQFFIVNSGRYQSLVVELSDTMDMESIEFPTELKQCGLDLVVHWVCLSATTGEPFHPTNAGIFET